MVAIRKKIKLTPGTMERNWKILSNLAERLSIVAVVTAYLDALKKAHKCIW